ncbi:Arc family DNA-binding protein [Pseudomonas synxantha]|uniref:Arc family DNA-binding protein n=1 Tax=Pseudomonas synxantha TaxID=47883 RepID=UPI0006149773|nr:Arc family DNA-binding protein [Pseudomonas synxantha]
MRSQLVAFVVRLPKELHEKIKYAATADSRSMNSDIVVRLERSFLAAQKYVLNTKVKSILFEHIEILESQIEYLNAELATFKQAGQTLEESPPCC